MYGFIDEDMAFLPNYRYYSTELCRFIQRLVKALLLCVTI